ncbi:MAG TPA: substrate-binding domain-containing protein [Thermomicrobiales bacterium]|nr:substrate-binding domain-containing protein [Thermomicrobiales bacterium]
MRNHLSPGMRTLVRQLEAGQIDRRTFLRRGLALGASLPTLGALLAAVGAPTPTVAAAPARQADQPVIGFLLRQKSQPRWTYDEQGFADEAKKLGVPYITQFLTEASAEEQQKAAENMLAQGIKVLVMVPFDPAAAGAIVDAAHAAGAKFVGYDETIPNVKYEFQLERDNEGVGKQMAEAAVAYAPKGNYVIVAGDQGTPVAVVKRDGAMKVIQPLVDKGDIDIVSDQYNKGWDPASAQTQVEQAITKAGGELNAVISLNDGMAVGAYSALDAAGLSDTTFVTGEDADLARVQLIAGGKPGTTIWTPIVEMGRTAAQIAASLAKGETPASDRTDNGIPVKLIPTTPITKDNIYDALIKIGFYTCDQVYQNVAKDQWPAQCAAATPTA